MRSSHSVLFLLPYPPNQGPSQRFRAEAYFPLLKQHQFKVGFRSFYDDKAWAVLYGKGSTFLKTWIVCKGFMKRLWQLLFVVPFYEFVFVQREATPLGPPFVEWVAVKVWRKKLIFDFDDATWIPNNTSESKLISWLKAFWKVKYLCCWAHTVAAGNDYLAAYASQYSQHVSVIPTVIDTDKMYRPRPDGVSQRLIVGWTGSHSTLKYLKLIEPVLQELQEQHDFDFLVIADKKPDLQLSRWSFLPWNAGEEVSDLQRLDIGIMPLPDDEWSKGKCGFKLIQYSGIGIPAVASPVGVNAEVISNQHTGYLAETHAEWTASLRHLLMEEEMRREMGRRGRKRIEEKYSLQSQTSAFLSLFTNRKKGHAS